MVMPSRMVPVSAARRAAAMAGCMAANSLRRKCWPKVMRSKPSSRAVRTWSMVSWKRSTSEWPGGCWLVRISPKRTVASCGYWWGCCKRRAAAPWLSSRRGSRRALPGRRVGAQRDGRPGPVGRGLGELQGRRELAQPADRRVVVDVQVGGIAEADGVLGVATGAEPLQPHAGLTERGADVVAAALAGSTGQRHQGAEGSEVAGGVVAGLGRHEVWVLGAALPDGEPGRALAELLPARPPGPRPDGAIAVDGDVDQAGAAPDIL